MSGAERVAAALQMSEEALEIATAGIRTRHPEWDADRVAHERRAVLLGRELAERLEEWQEARKLQVLRQRKPGPSRLQDVHLDT